MRSLTFLFHFFFIAAFVSAQNSPRPVYSISPKLHYGYIWNFADEVAHLSNQHMPAFELDIIKQTKGNKAWQQEYRLPQVGYSLSYFAFDPSKPVGNALVALIHGGKNLYKTPRTNMQWRLGAGMAYVEKRFDVYSNYKNNVISQRINFALNGQINFNCRLSSALFFTMGIGLVHISNGSLQKPNFGVNLPTISTGIGINIIDTKEPNKVDSVGKFSRKTFLHIAPFAGLKEVYPVNGPKYFLAGFNAYVERRMNRKSGLNIGIDCNYDQSKKSEIMFDTIDVKNIVINRTQVGFIVGHELYINKLSMLTQLGVYAFDPTHINKAIYQKVGFKYYVSDKIFVSMIMKIHLGVADWIEWGGGLRL